MRLAFHGHTHQNTTSEMWQVRMKQLVHHKSKILTTMLLRWVLNQQIDHSLMVIRNFTKNHVKNHATCSNSNASLQAAKQNAGISLPASWQFHRCEPSVVECSPGNLSGQTSMHSLYCHAASVLFHTLFAKNDTCSHEVGMYVPTAPMSSVLDNS